ncbi:MAG: SDR family oxidoreductase [Alphaproteobacteria bacterium]|nr:SDR family oxidoreductase [Alphaproteobacteria bacterium]MBU0805018.1 SDR family oxidoreductase [Alphaproteobacteria bacterium]MBU0870517.1 SDR family oxidoreductase [Alphaproteobacteria bacterium]MBU1401808.1 SDR family oxidoreductase [Alphaproteobacteria bacterium]MBU1591775.1 SDR family oxidoreductase [Alphaproteobacteria bacterium]
MRQDLTGRVALVTGASSGIGRAMARALAAEGMRVALIGRSTDRLNLLTDEIGSQAAAIAADLTNADQLENAVAETVARFGPIDVLLPNAGVYISGDVAEGDPDAWDRLIAINVSSVFRLVRAVLPGMIARQSGHIIVTSSVSGHQAFHGEPIYSASKHAIQSFVHGLRRQVAGHNIRVGEVSPGVVLNELWGYTDAASIAAKVEEREGLQSEDVAEAVVFMLTRPPNVTIRDLVILPQNEDV